MKIIQIYKKYNVPTTLQHHMLLVASLGKYILKKQDDRANFVIQALLLHDIGSLIKFDLNQSIKLFDSSESDLKYWKRIQKEMINIYGADEHIATLKITNSILKSNKVTDLIKKIDSNNLERILKSKNYLIKVGVYCDFRATNNKYVSIDERFRDIIKRYKDRDGFIGIKETLKKRDLCKALEKQIEKRFNISLTKLPVNKIKEIQKDLINFDL